ncbi:hypothetical protein MRB53_013722 [Persea americana]|uniref:Uncharacterized protein n=1 Tax=Persea americana TaxID=3435 RepID=A0ACC2K8V8_PERAE|nr:hypothetical protein MRB53_013722 [Persea americana]
MNLLIQEVIPYNLMHGSYGEITWPSVWFSWRTFLILRKASVVFCVGGTCADDFCFTVRVRNVHLDYYGTSLGGGPHLLDVSDARVNVRSTKRGFGVSTFYGVRSFLTLFSIPHAAYGIRRSDACQRQ